MYFWPKLKWDVARFVKHANLVRQQVKTLDCIPPCSFPSTFGKILYMDFILGLPKTPKIGLYDGSCGQIFKKIFTACKKTLDFSETAWST